jgi:hypothetical protein
VYGERLGEALSASFKFLLSAANALFCMSVGEGIIYYLEIF